MGFFNSLLTLRELIGIDPNAVEEHFKTFLHTHPELTAKQVQFLNLLKNYIAEHGTITVNKLYEPPFNSVSHEGIDGVFKPEDVNQLIVVLKPYLKDEAQTTESRG